MSSEAGKKYRLNANFYPTNMGLFASITRIISCILGEPKNSTEARRHADFARRILKLLKEFREGNDEIAENTPVFISLTLSPRFLEEEDRHLAQKLDDNLWVAFGVTPSEAKAMMH